MARKTGGKGLMSSQLTLVLLAMLLLICSRALAAADSPLGSPAEQAKIQQFDRTLQGLAFKAFKHPKTGIIISVELPASMQGDVQAQAVRLRSGSLRRRGFIFNEFSIPPGAGVVHNQVPVRVVLVYRKFTQRLYEVQGYRFISSVLGVRVYDAFNLSSTDAFPELEFAASDSSRNISVGIPVLMGESTTGAVVCAAFDSDGSFSLSNVTASPSSSSTISCSSDRLRDFALMVPMSQSPVPISSPAPSPPSSISSNRTKKKKRSSRRWKVILGGVVGGFAGLLLLLLLAFGVAGCVRRKKMEKMERASERGEALQSSLVRNSRAPVAAGARTRPVLESDYAA